MYTLQSARASALRRVKRYTDANELAEVQVLAEKLHTDAPSV